MLDSVGSNERIDFKTSFFFLVLVASLRMVLETILGNTSILETPFHYNFLFLFSFYSISLVVYTFLLSLLSSKKPVYMSRILTLFLLLALIVPVLDYGISFISGQEQILYATTGIGDFDIIRLSASNPVGETMVLWLIPIASCIYVYLLRRSIVRTILTFIVTFLSLFFVGIDIPAFMGFGMDHYYLYAALVFTILSPAMLYIQNPEKFVSLFKRFHERLNRIVFYVLLFVFGIEVAGSVFYVDYIGLHIFSILIISFMATVFNDYYDFGTDNVNKKNNLLSIFSKKDIQNSLLISLMILVLVLVFLLHVGSIVFVACSVSILSLIFIYSFRNMSKHLFPLNYIADALSLSIIFIAGKSLVAMEYHDFGLFLLLTLIFFLVVPLKDFKDWRGDKTTGIKTLYTLIDRNKAFTISKIFLLSSYVLWLVLVTLFSPQIGLWEIVGFYILPSLIFVLVSIKLSKGKPGFERSLWLLDLLFVIYMVPFL